jgi:hypothetical protein
LPRPTNRTAALLFKIVMPDKRTLNIEDYLKLHGREDLVDWMDYK